MAEPLLDFLTGRAKAALPFLRGAVSQGLNTNQIIDALAASGIGTFQRQRMLDIIAALQNRADVEGKPTLLQRYLRLVPPTTPLPREAHTVEVVVNLANNYNYLVKITDPESPVPRWVTVVSDIPLSAETIKAVAETYQSNYTQFMTEAGVLPELDYTIARADVSINAP